MNAYDPADPPEHAVWCPRCERWDEDCRCPDPDEHCGNLSRERVSRQDTVADFRAAAFYAESPDRSGRAIHGIRSLNLPAVSVLTEAENKRTGSPSVATDVSRSVEVGEVREGTMFPETALVAKSDSRGGGQSDLRSMQTEKGAQSVKNYGATAALPIFLHLYE